MPSRSSSVLGVVLVLCCCAAVVPWCRGAVRAVQCFAWCLVLGGWSWVLGRYVIGAMNATQSQVSARIGISSPALVGSPQSSAEQCSAARQTRNKQPRPDCGKLYLYHAMTGSSIRQVGSCSLSIQWEKKRWRWFLKLSISHSPSIIHGWRQRGRRSLGPVKRAQSWSQTPETDTLRAPLRRPSGVIWGGFRPGQGRSWGPLALKSSPR